LRTGNAPLLNAGLVLLSAGLLLSALVARTYSLDPPPQAKACGPPLYSCSRTDLKVTQPDKAPMIDFGGLKGANSVFHDALYNNVEIVRCTDALTHPSFPNGSYSVGLGGAGDKNSWNTNDTHDTLQTPVDDARVFWPCVPLLVNAFYQGNPSVFLAGQLGATLLKNATDISAEPPAVWGGSRRQPKVLRDTTSP
jgi:hypothetical protein